MSLESVLEGLGLSASQRDSLLADEWFKVRNEEVLKERVGAIRGIYGCSARELGEIVLRFPPFAGLDHARVLQEAVETYGAENTGRVKEAVLKFPSFAGLDHTRVLQEAVETYGADHAGRVKEAVLKHPPFAGLDHARVLREAVQVYGADHAGRVKEAVLKFPQFASLDHARVLRQRCRLGRLVGLSTEKVLYHILDNPVLAGYSAKRYLAGLDICRSLAAEGSPQGEMLAFYFTYISKSPYVPGTKRKRISQVADTDAGYAEPPLMKVMRKSLRRRMES